MFLCNTAGGVEKRCQVPGAFFPPYLGRQRHGQCQSIIEPWCGAEWFVDEVQPADRQILRLSPRPGFHVFHMLVCAINTPSATQYAKCRNISARKRGTWLSFTGRCQLLTFNIDRGLSVDESYILTYLTYSTCICSISLSCKTTPRGKAHF